MRTTLGVIRNVIRKTLAESGWGAYPGGPDRNVLAPAESEREQLGTLAAEPMDTADDPDGVPAHLREPTVDPRDCHGPVPPTFEEPYVSQDPFVRDYGPQPFSGGGSIRRG